MVLRYSLAYFLLLFLSACNTSDDTSPDIFNIETEFAVSLSQNLSEQGPKLVIELLSIAADHCEEDQLIVELSQNTQQVSLNIKGLDQYADCDDAVYQIKEEVALELANANYLLSLDIGNTIDNSGTINVREDLFQINLLSPTGIMVTKSSIKKVPTGMIWGQITAPPSLNDIESKLRDDIRSLALSNNAHSQLEGDYGFMQINSFGELAITDGFLDLIEIDSGNLFFDQIAQSNLSSLLQLIGTYRDANPELDIQLYDWAGNQH